MYVCVCIHTDVRVCVYLKKKRPKNVPKCVVVGVFLFVNF